MISSHTYSQTVPGVEKLFPGSLFPSDDVAKKNRNWHLQAAKAIWSEYQKSPYYHYTGTIRELRAYAKGEQSSDRYKARLDINSNKSYLNLDFTNPKLAPKYIDVALGMLGRLRHKVQARSVDPISVSAREQYEHFLNAMDIIRSMSDSDIVQEMAQAVPVGEEEIELHMSMDYKQALEIAMEHGIELVMQKNEYEDLVAEDVRRNLFELGVGGTKVYVDDSGMVRVRSVDPAQLVLPPTRTPNFSDARYIGEIVYYTIAELKEMDTNGDMSPQDWKKVIQLHLNTGSRKSGISYLHQARGMYGYSTEFDSMRIPVLDFEYLTYDKLVYEKKENRFGSYTINEREPDYEPPKKSKYKREVIKNTFKNYRKGKWILNSDFVLDWGMCDYMVRGNESEGQLADAKSSYSIWCVGLKQGDVVPVSHLKRMIPSIDQHQLARLKLQNLLAKARPKGVSFDIDAIAAIAARLGMGQNDVREVMRWFNAEGNMPYSSTAMAEIFSSTGHYAQHRPVEELQNGIDQNAIFYVELMQNSIREIQEVTGLNDGVDAGPIDPSAPVGTTRLAAAGATNSLMGLVKAYKNILTNTSFCIARKLQQVVQKGPISGHIRRLGDSKIETIKLGAEISYAEFGLYIEDLPTDEELQRLEMLVLKALDTRMSHGRGGITLNVALKALRLAKSNAKEAERYLDVQHEKQRQIDQQQSMQEMQMNAQLQQQSAAQNHQGKMQEMQMEHQMEMERQSQSHADSLEQIMMQAQLKGQNELDQEVVSQAGKERLEKIRSRLKESESSSKK